LRTSTIRAKKRKLGKLKKYFFIRTEEEKHLATDEKHGKR
jgi:hypothetical protein